MANYLAFLPDPGMQNRLREAVGDGPGRREQVSLHFCASWDELRERARALLPDVVVFDPHNRRILDAASCGRFAAEFPTVVLFAYADFDNTPRRDVFSLARAGVRDIAERGRDDGVGFLRILLADALQTGAADRILNGLRDRIPSELIVVVQAVLRSSDEQPTPEEMAGFYYRDQRTLREHLRRAGLPSINRLAIWVRLLRAGDALRHRHRTVENVALVAGFGSVNVFRNQLRLYAGVSVQEMGSRGGYDFLLGEFLRRYPDRDGQASGEYKSSGRV